MSRAAADAMTRPLIVQGDMSLLLEVQHPRYADARDAIAPFAELTKSPEYMHSYRISPLSVWNAASAGLSLEAMETALHEFSRYPVPKNVLKELRSLVQRFGKIQIHAHGDELKLSVLDSDILALLKSGKRSSVFFGQPLSDHEFLVPGLSRGPLKRAFIKVGYPVDDCAGTSPGEPLALDWRAQTGGGHEFSLRAYQQKALDNFFAGGEHRGATGVVVLPCGAGKTLVGLGAVVRLQRSALVLTTGVTAVKQWIAEALDKTSLSADQVGEYSANTKDIKPVTVSTYQMLTYRSQKNSDFVHFDLFRKRDWGLIIYDEVHLLPAPVFQVTAEIQARRRLGLTATLVREDGLENEVFALIGPKRFDSPWKDMEQQGWIARASCIELRVPMSETTRKQYNQATRRQQYKIAAQNPAKAEWVEAILKRHPDAPTLIIGTYLEQLKELAESLDAPVLTGRTSNKRRAVLYKAFREGQQRVLVVSKVANFAIDLPDAAVAVQVSGTFGSRQEEAQRLGRILRPKRGDNQAWFYTLVSEDSVDQERAMHRQLFLTEQGYSYSILDELPQ